MRVTFLFCVRRTALQSPLRPKHGSHPRVSNQFYWVHRGAKLEHFEWFDWLFPQIGRGTSLLRSPGRILHRSPHAQPQLSGCWGQDSSHHQDARQTIPNLLQLDDDEADGVWEQHQDGQLLRRHRRIVLFLLYQVAAQLPNAQLPPPRRPQP